MNLKKWALSVDTDCLMQLKKHYFDVDDDEDCINDWNEINRDIWNAVWVDQCNNHTSCKIESPIRHYDFLRMNTSFSPSASSSSGYMTGSTRGSRKSSMSIDINTNGGSKRLHVSNIPFKFREIDLRNLFEIHGEITSAEIIFNQKGSMGYGFVSFTDCDSAEKARNALDGTKIGDRIIQVNPATPKKKEKKRILKLKSEL